MRMIVFSLSAALLILSACEKEIEVNLNDSEPSLNAEAYLTAGEQVFITRVSRTANYFDSSQPLTVDDATVSLTDLTSGEVTELTLSAPGLYSAPITGQINHSYALNLEVDEIAYLAESQLLPPVTIESVETEIVQFGFGGGGNDDEDDGEDHLAFLRFNDAAEEDNYYRIDYRLNGEEAELADTQVLEDDLFNGGLARAGLRGTTFSPGDSVHFELWHVDEKAYAYFNSLADILGNGRGPGGSTAAPGNPDNNWNGPILGNFTAYSRDSFTIIIPE